MSLATQVSLALFFLSHIAVAETAKTAKEYVVNDSNGRDTIRFVLDAPFEVINGSTNAVKGKFVAETKGLSGSFEVPVKTIKTGIDKRDEHLQNDKWMNAEKFPTLSFEFSAAKIPDSVWKGQEATMDVNGKLTIHGVTRTEKVKLVLRYFPESKTTQARLPGNLLRAKAEFKIKLADFGIAQSDSKVKELLGLKVGETAAVTVDVMASDQAKL